MAADAVGQMAAIRSLYEGMPVTIDLLAAAAKRAPGSLTAAAKRNGWVAPRGKGAKARTERLNQLVDYLIGKLEAIRDACGASETLDKAQIDAITQLTRALDKIGEITRSTEGAKENQTKNDGTVADVLKRIDERIVELAVEYAKRLGDQQRLAS